MSRTLNQGRNAITDALVEGRNIEIVSIALRRDAEALKNETNQA